ncbi:MAG: ribosome silencing factor [Pseudomonadota bacterium]
MVLTTEGQAGAAHLAPLDPSDQLAIVLKSLDNSKAEDIIAIDLEGKTPLADHMVVASGRSHRHVGAVADHLLRALKDAGVKGVRVEGLSAADWVLVDAGDVIIHVFRPEVRTFYNLEKMWQLESATQIEVVV